MSSSNFKRGHRIKADMTVLDVILRYRETEAVFRSYDEVAGVCICCEALFEPLSTVAQRYGLELERLLADLEAKALDIKEQDH